jgi:hypothetical protein
MSDIGIQLQLNSFQTPKIYKEFNMKLNHFYIIVIIRLNNL